MIDATVDPDFAAFERQESFKESRPVGADAAGTESASRTVVYRGRLSALSSQSDHQAGTLLSPPPTPTTATTTPPPDPLRHLQTARLGFALVLILICYWLWRRIRNMR